MNNKPDVIMAIIKLSRAMRRRPIKQGAEPPMAGGRLLSVLKENNNVTSRELAELLDIRPSSLTELIGKMEQEQLVIRTQDENDRRISRVSLTEKGTERENEITAARAEHLEKFSACFSDEEAAQFCEMCDRLTAHLESMSVGRDMPDDFGGDFPHHGPHGHRHGCRCGHHGPHGGRHGHGFPPAPPPSFGDFFPDDSDDGEDI